MDELGRQRERGELVLALMFTATTALGAWLGASLLTLFGIIGALSSITLYLWQRTCLIRLSYSRKISETRANFGQHVSIEIELSNDKILPLPWVRVIDHFPRGLFPDLVLPEDGFSSVELMSPVKRAMNNILIASDYGPNGSQASQDRDHDQSSQLVAHVQSFAMLPFERVFRTIDVVCSRRGRHRFARSEIISGDPLGIRPRSMTIDTAQEIIVYPKMFRILVPSLFSRTPLGDERAKRHLLGDPTRVVGMRPYRQGDPLRHIDWRATARRSELLVRDFEPTTTLRLTLFVDCNLRPHEDTTESTSPTEFAISLAASLVAWATDLGIPTGLYVTGMADNQPIGARPISGPQAVRSLMELLALCQPDSASTLSDALSIGSEGLEHETSAIVITSDFTPELLVSIAACRRKAPVTAIYIDGLGGTKPPRQLVDESYEVAFQPSWQGVDHVIIA